MTSLFSTLNFIYQNCYVFLRLPRIPATAFDKKPHLFVELRIISEEVNAAVFNAISHCPSSTTNVWLFSNFIGSETV